MKTWFILLLFALGPVLHAQDLIYTGAIFAHDVVAPANATELAYTFLTPQGAGTETLTLSGLTTVQVEIAGPAAQGTAGEIPVTGGSHWRLEATGDRNSLLAVDWTVLDVPEPSTGDCIGFSCLAFALFRALRLAAANRK